eukprot:3783529-Ditylum_brightwellii.AAC.1
MTTCQKKKEAFAHVMGTVLDFKVDSPMMIAMSKFDYGFIKYIITMDKEEIVGLLYTLKVTKGDKDVAVDELLHLLWWHDHEESLRASKLVTTEDWLQLTADKFDIFVDTVAANIARTVIKMGPDAASTVTIKQVNNFQREHKRDLTVFKHLNGNCRM